MGSDFVFFFFNSKSNRFRFIVIWKVESSTLWNNRICADFVFFFFFVFSFSTWKTVSRSRSAAILIPVRIVPGKWDVLYLAVPFYVVFPSVSIPFIPPRTTPLRFPRCDCSYYVAPFASSSVSSCSPKYSRQVLRVSSCGGAGRNARDEYSRARWRIHFVLLVSPPKIPRILSRLSDRFDPPNRNFLRSLNILLVFFSFFLEKQRRALYNMLHIRWVTWDWKLKYFRNDQLRQEICFQRKVELKSWKLYIFLIRYSTQLVLLCKKRY